MFSLSDVLERIGASVEELFAALPSIIIGFCVFLIIYRASRPATQLASQVLDRSLKRHNVSLVLSRLVRGSIILLGMLIGMMIAIPSFQPEELIELLGITSIAIGFAFRDILQNFLAGILLLLTEPFTIGDQIVVGDYEGTVEDIQSRATYLRTYDNRRVVIPNSDLFTGSVIVNTAYDRRRSEYEVGIDYTDHIENAETLMIAVMKEIPGVMEYPPPDTIMMGMADSALIIRIRWWTDPRQNNVLGVQTRVLRTIKNRLTEEGFNIPFPIRTVYFHNQSQTDEMLQ